MGELGVAVGGEAKRGSGSERDARGRGKGRRGEKSGSTYSSLNLMSSVSISSLAILLLTSSLTTSQLEREKKRREVSLNSTRRGDGNKLTVQR